MLYVINYANKKYRRAQKLNSKTAKKYGKANKVIEYGQADIDDKFYNKNKKIFSYTKGNGYWLWKSYIVKKTLDKINYNDYLMYCDSGAYFINDINLLIENMKRDNQDLMCFELDNIEKNWSKRDAFILLGCDKEKYYNSNQIMATTFIIKKTKYTIKFVEEWIKYAQDERIITDIANQLGKGNYDGFKENRHDQTIFSLLCKKYGYIPYRDPSQNGINILKDNSKFPQIIQLHRYGFCKTKLEVKIFKFLSEKLLNKLYTPKK